MVALPPCPACGEVIEGNGGDPDLLDRLADHVIGHLREGVRIRVVVIECGDCLSEPVTTDPDERLRRDMVRGMGGVI